MPSEFTPAPDETILARPRPSLWMIVLDGAGAPILLGALAASCMMLWYWKVDTPVRLLLILVILYVILAASIVAWRCLDLLTRDYILTTRRVIERRGVLNRISAEAPLTAVQNTVLVQSLSERIVGVGTIGFSTAGSPGFEVVWRIIANPADTMALVRRALDAASGGGGTGNNLSMPTGHSTPPQPPALPRTRVLGIAGGIGSGKSTAAAAFGSLGCLVIDSDARAKAALDRPDVKHTLVSWWGTAILDADGRVDRAKVASIIFGNTEERRRLEELVHPIVRQDRAAMIREIEGRPRGSPRPPAVIIDAPLLFEAGLDAECDAVVFIDAPRAHRAARVKRTRNWEESELDRREAAQWPFEKKRAASRFLINNPDPPADLVPQARAILAELGNLPPRGNEPHTDAPRPS